MKTIINESQRGLLFKNGKFIKMLMPGKYHYLPQNKIEVLSLENSISIASCPLETLLTDKQLASQATVVEVGDQQLALHFIDGKFANILTAGKHAFWSAVKKHEFQVADISNPEVSDDVPKYIFEKSPSTGIRVSVADYQKARLYYDGKFIKLLEPGVYYFWRTSVRVSVDFVDTRLTQMDIIGQEILTQDKVSLRINFVCNYRITDYIKTMTEIDDFKEQIHVAAQLALRAYVGKHKLDEILDNKDDISKYVFERLKEKEKELYVEITDADVKDIILPGEIRDIMNTVLVAEKRAQANVITRREEVASTRSLLNTAKLMDENKTLYKLKELEYIERICENVGNINLNAGGDIITQLTSILRS